MPDSHGQGALPPWLSASDDHGAPYESPQPSSTPSPRHGGAHARTSDWGDFPEPVSFDERPMAQQRPVEEPIPTNQPLPEPVSPTTYGNATEWPGRSAAAAPPVAEPAIYAPPPSLPSTTPASPPSGGPAPQWGTSIPGDLTPPTALDQSNLIAPARRRPKSGLRGFIYNSTRGKLNLGESAREHQERQLEEQIRTPLRGDYRIAVLSLKGGVGKTTTTVALGGAFASIRGDRVIAVDANPDFGTLANRVAAPGSHTIRDLLNSPDTSRYADVRSFTTQAESRLEVIGSERDPAVSEAFSEDDYRQAIDILQHHYNIILTDCGTGLMHSAMKGVLELANMIIVVASGSMDSAQSADATLNWLSIHGYQDLVANAIVVISAGHPGTASVDQNTLINHFRSRTRAVQEVPFDRHLSEGGVVDIDLLDKSTRHAYLELAALVAEDFSSWHRHAE